MSPHSIILARPKPPARRQQVPAGDGFGIVLVSTLVLGVIFLRPSYKKKETPTPIPDDLLLRVNPEPANDPFRYRVTA